MSKKNKKNNEEELDVDFNEDDAENDDSYDLDDEDFPKSSKELKAEAKAQAKKEKQDELDRKDAILNPKSRTVAGQTFKMYKFIIKIAIVAILIAFGIVLCVFQKEMIGAVYMVSGIAMAFSAIIRMVPLLKTSKAHRTRLILFIQCCIHLVLGAYLILAAFYHWNILEKIAEQGLAGTLEEQLNDISGGWFAKFNIIFYSYALVIFFFTLSIGYFWTTIQYHEATGNTLFWLMMISNTLAVAIAMLAHWLDANTLVWCLVVIVFLGAVVVAGEAGGGYFRYRKTLVSEKPVSKKAAKTEGKEAPARNDKVDYTDIDPTTIPVEDPQDDAIVS